MFDLPEIPPNILALQATLVLIMVCRSRVGRGSANTPLGQNESLKIYPQQQIKILHVLSAKLFISFPDLRTNSLSDNYFFTEHDIITNNTSLIYEQDFQFTSMHLHSKKLVEL